MSKRAILLVGASVLLGFIVGRIPTQSRAGLLGTSAVKQGETQVSSNDPLGSALGELVGSTDLASMARLGPILNGLDAEQMRQLLDRFVGAPSDPSRERLEWILAHWTKRDPAAAAAWIRPHLDAAAQDGPPGHDFNTGTRGRLILAWAKADPQEALAYAKEHSRTGIAGALLDKAIENWPEKDPAQRLAVIQQFPAGKARNEALGSFLWRWAAKEPSAALAVAQGIGDDAERNRAFGYILQQWAERDPKTVFEQYRALNVDVPYVLSRALSKAAEKDPRQAIEWLSSLTPGQFARHAPSVAQVWAGRDPAAALSWALENGVAVSSRGESWEEIVHNGLGRSTNSRFSIGSALSSAFESKPEETLAWVRSLPAGADRERMLELSGDYLRTAQQRVALFNELSPDAALRSAASVARRFDSVNEGRVWVESLPPGPTRLEAWRGLGGIDSAASVDLPSGAERDAMLSGRAFSMSGRSTPIPNLEIIAQIGDSALKRELFDQAMDRSAQYAGSNWMRQSLDELEKTDFPEEWKQLWRALAK